MKSNFDCPPVTQTDNAWVEYAMIYTFLSQVWFRRTQFIDICSKFYLYLCYVGLI